MSDQDPRPPRPACRWARLAARGLACLVLVALVWGAGLVWFVAGVPKRVADPVTHTDAIVVLTGGSERVATGLALLAAGLGDRLFISGVHKGVSVSQLLRSHHGPRLLAQSVTLGYVANDTVGNAAETAAWAARLHLRSLRLVTAAYHMPRSLWEFRQVMPHMVIIPHPVFPDAVKRRDWWRRPGTATLLATEYSKYLAAVVRHWIIPPKALVP